MCSGRVGVCSGRVGVCSGRVGVCSEERVCAVGSRCVQWGLGVAVHASCQSVGSVV